MVLVMMVIVVMVLWWLLSGRVPASFLSSFLPFIHTPRQQVGNRWNGGHPLISLNGTKEEKG